MVGTPRALRSASALRVGARATETDAAVKSEAAPPSPGGGGAPLRPPPPPPGTDAPGTAVPANGPPVRTPTPPEMMTDLTEPTTAPAVAEPSLAEHAETIRTLGKRVIADVIEI